MAQLSVITIQRGLTVFSQRTGSPSPGRVDGAWGPNTRAAYEPFVGRIAPEHGLDPAVVMTYVAAAETGSRLAIVPAQLAEVLESLSRQYSPPARPPSRPQPPAAQVPSMPGMSNNTATTVGVILGIVAFGGAAWWLLRRS